MKKIAIIGGGIVGLTLAHYLDLNQFEVTIFDEGTGQGTKASAGIISPWLSKRRNKKWYQLAKDGAHFYQKLQQDFHLDETIYQQNGTIFLRPEKDLPALFDLATLRKESAPEIGDIEFLSPKETTDLLPLLNPAPALFISGGARLDGKAYLEKLTQLGIKKGITLLKGKAQLISKDQLRFKEEEFTFDKIILTPGPYLKELLEPLGYQVDVRPQKGQLLVFETPFKESGAWPVAMLEGEGDCIPFMAGKVFLGATHENDEKWDLTPTKKAYQQLVSGTQNFFKEGIDFSDYPLSYQIGTRAYTTDFAPFFGELTENLYVASGLGSSGLTTGPLIGFLLAEAINSNKADFSQYSKPVINYIK